MRRLQNILVTGGAGFIGVNFIEYLFKKTSFSGKIYNVDALTYAGNAFSLEGIQQKYPSRYTFIHADICDTEKMDEIVSTCNIDTIVHFAAESHVDRSILGPATFVQTNIMGTFSLLEASRKHWRNRDDVVFHHISTDEVFGSLGDKGFFTEETSYDPRSPYSASKASSDHLVRAYYHTYGLPVTMSNCSNNYGPFQFPEKLIPVMITNMLEGKALPIYGDGKNIRDWLYVEDHASAIWSILQEGVTGSSYNVGGENEWENITLVEELCKIVSEEAQMPLDQLLSTITYVKDRPGHDRRYAIDCSTIKDSLKWSQSVTFGEGLRNTVRWYLDNTSWSDQIKSGEYQLWLEKNYGER
jgi:dTDP-glucose 4,6-dehydratase